MSNVNFIDGYKELVKKAKVSLEFQFIRDTDLYGNISEYTIQEQRDMIEIIRNTASFNARNSINIANTFLNFYNSLPKLYLGENNPNNGSYLFQSVKLISDDTIELETYHNVDTETLKTIEILVNDYGRQIKADEHRVVIDKVSDTFSYTKIIFWWD